MQYQEQALVLWMWYFGNFKVDMQEPARNNWHYGLDRFYFECVDLLLSLHFLGCM